MLETQVVWLLSESSVLVFPWIGELKSLRELVTAVMNEKGHELHPKEPK